MNRFRQWLNVSSGCRRTSTTASGSTREHLLEIAAHGFEAVELFATRTHFDYHNPAAVADLQQWLAEAGLALHGVHAPIAETLHAAAAGARRSTLASADPDARARAVAEAERALHIARRIPFDGARRASRPAAHRSRRSPSRQQPRRRRAAASRSCSGWPSRSACRSRSK